MGGTAVSISGSSFQDVMARSLEAARAAGIDTGEDEEEWEDEDGGGNNEDFVSEFKRRLAVGDSGFSSNRAAQPPASIRFHMRKHTNSLSMRIDSAWTMSTTRPATSQTIRCTEAATRTRISSDS